MRRVGFCEFNRFIRNVHCESPHAPFWPIMGKIDRYAATTRADIEKIQSVRPRLRSTQVCKAHRPMLGFWPWNKHRLLHKQVEVAERLGACVAR